MDVIIRTIYQKPVEYVKLSIYLWSLVDTFYYENIDYSSAFITVILTADIFITKKTDIKVHHVMAILFYIYVNVNGMTAEDKFLISRPVMVCEVSSIFLAVNDIYENEIKPQYVIANQLLFVSTFFYYRVYYFYVSSIINLEYNETVSKYDSFYWDKIIWSTLYVFYTLNLYWAFLIGKKIYRKISSSVSKRE
jgi:hypothetical protein